MSEKSHVSMAVTVCPLCEGKEPTNEILLDKRLRASMERETVVGIRVCQKCVKEATDNQQIILLTAHENGHLTGEIMHIKESAFTQVFPGEEVPPGRVAMVSQEVTQELIALASRAGGTA